MTYRDDQEMVQQDYYELPGLGDVYVEDSFVLDVRQSRNTIVFDLDLVLTESHECYQTPPEGEQHCYRRAHLIFEAVTEATWDLLTFVVSTDKNGERDFGNIDEFSFVNGEYRLSGEWGRLRIRSTAPALKPIS